MATNFKFRGDRKHDKIQFKITTDCGLVLGPRAQCRQYIQIGFLTLDHWQQKRVSLQIDGCVTLIISGENIQVLLWWRMEEGVNSFPWPDGWKELQTKADLLSELIGSAESGGNEMRSKDGQQNARRRRRTKYCSTLGADQCDQIGLL